MKKQVFLFLFFALTLIGFKQNYLHAQEPVDSLKYYHNVILNPESSKNFSSAFLFFEKSIENQLEEGDIISAVQNLRRIAIGQYELGFLYESEATAVRALKLLENLENNTITREAMSGVLNHLGIVYRQLKSYNKALSYFNEALRLAVDYSDSIPTLNNITYLLLDQNEFEMALKNSSFVLKKKQKQKDSMGLARALDNYGIVQSKMNMPEALDNLKSALGIWERKNDLRGMYSSHQHLSKYYFEIGDRDNSLEHAERAYELAKQLNSATYIVNALSLILDLSENHRVLDYKKLTDSLTLSKQVQENKYAMVKYNVEKERQKAQKAELQKEREKTYKTIFISAFIFSIMIAAFVVYQKNQQRKREVILTAQKTEARISKRVHDGLANDVSGVMTFVENRLNISTGLKDRLLDYLNSIYIRARDISTANAGVDVSDFTKALKSMIAQHHPKGVKIVTAPYSNINWNAIPDYKKTAVYKSLQELLVNTQKHAKGSLIGISFNKKGRMIEIVYSDNGIGFDPDKILMGGLKNVETRMTEIGGSFSFESNEGKGFRASLLF